MSGTAPPLGLLATQRQALAPAFPQLATSTPSLSTGAAPTQPPPPPPPSPAQHGSAPAASPMARTIIETVAIRRSWSASHLMSTESEIIGNARITSVDSRSRVLMMVSAAVISALQAAGLPVTMPTQAAQVALYRIYESWYGFTSKLKITPLPITGPLFAIYLAGLPHDRRFGYQAVLEGYRRVTSPLFMAQSNLPYHLWTTEMADAWLAVVEEMRFPLLQWKAVRELAGTPLWTGGSSLPPPPPVTAPALPVAGHSAPTNSPNQSSDAPTLSSTAEGKRPALEDTSQIAEDPPQKKPRKKYTLADPVALQQDREFRAAGAELYGAMLELIRLRDAARKEALAVSLASSTRTSSERPSGDTRPSPSHFKSTPRLPPPSQQNNTAAPAFPPARTLAYPSVLWDGEPLTFIHPSRRSAPVPPPPQQEPQSSSHPSLGQWNKAAGVPAWRVETTTSAAALPPTTSPSTGAPLPVLYAPAQFRTITAPSGPFSHPTPPLAFRPSAAVASASEQANQQPVPSQAPAPPPPSVRRVPAVPIGPFTPRESLHYADALTRLQMLEGRAPKRPSLTADTSVARFGNSTVSSLISTDSTVSAGISERGTGGPSPSAATFGMGRPNTTAVRETAPVAHPFSVPAPTPASGRAPSALSIGKTDPPPPNSSMPSPPHSAESPPADPPAPAKAGFDARSTTTSPTVGSVRSFAVVAPAPRRDSSFASSGTPMAKAGADAKGPVEKRAPTISGNEKERGSAKEVKVILIHDTDSEEEVPESDNEPDLVFEVPSRFAAASTPAKPFG